MALYEAADTSKDMDNEESWLKFAKDAFERSTTYLENNYRKQWEDGIRMFNSKHSSDSKYNSEAFKYRSKIFRPKSRSVVRKHEATAALAFFSNPDAVSVDPVNTEDVDQVASAVIMKELLNYRLSKSIKWFLISIGAFQDAMTTGIVASFNYWRYKTKKVTKEMQGVDPNTGSAVTFEMEVDEVVEDQPCIELLPVENIRFDPAAQWHDVVNTSPYVIVLFPTYIRDVLERMESGEWNALSEDEIKQCRVDADQTLNDARTDNKEDPQQQTSEIGEFDVVMAHLNFIKLGSETYTYWTLKDKKLLTKPKPIREVFLHGEIPVTVGFSVLETHKSIPSSLIGLGSQLQSEANEIANQRLDNVKFVLNKRWFVKRGANVDMNSIVRNVPGGATMVNDPEKDIREVNWQDVTSSAYAEQDRVNVDFDELLGNFAQSSVMTNRRLNETVGGMKMMAQGANTLTEYTIRLYVESWMEPTLRQLVKLEQAYETDEVVIAIVAQRANLFQRYGTSDILDNLLNKELTLNVNVGMGATDPEARFQRFMMASGAYSKLALEGPPDMNLSEVRKELFGLAGFRDAKRFFTDLDVRAFMMEQMENKKAQEAQQLIDGAKDHIQRRERQLDMREMGLKLSEAESNVKEKVVDIEQQRADALNKLAKEIATRNSIRQTQLKVVNQGD